MSIHTIVTTSRESFYWLAVLVTFAVGAAAGDYTIELTGWSPGVSVLARVRPHPALGANVGDFLSADRSEGGLGLGTMMTSVLFLATILVTVVYLTRTRKDQIERVRPQHASLEQPASAPAMD